MEPCFSCIWSISVIELTHVCGLLNHLSRLQCISLLAYWRFCMSKNLQISSFLGIQQNLPPEVFKRLSDPCGACHWKDKFTVSLKERSHFPWYVLLTSWFVCANFQVPFPSDIESYLDNYHTVTPITQEFDIDSKSVCRYLTYSWLLLFDHNAVDAGL